MSGTVIIDYGLGNLFNVKRALEKVGGTDINISHELDAVTSADRLVLPGVGAFGDGMKNIRQMGIEDAIRTEVSHGKPILGVCLGMQLLMSESEEFGYHEGLCLIPGKVRKLNILDGGQAKIPHIGWGAVQNATDKKGPTNSWGESVLKGLRDGCYMYFVHSYVVEPDDLEVQIGVTEYGGDMFCSVLKSNNITGVQFHPELSSEPGLQIYKDFLDAS